MICIRCGSEHTQKNGSYKGMQRYKCMDCNKKFNSGIYEDNYFFHFNAKLKKNDRNILTRDNYCTPTNKISSDEKKIIKELNITIPNEIYADEEHYSNKFVEQHYIDCMKNFDLNMRYFEKLDSNDFNKELNSYIRKNKFRETKKLDDLDINGIYILVLDKYKQVYIGMSGNIRRRILNHWSKKKEFGRLIYGTVEDSILHIDSFGALDTTRIFYKKINANYDINLSEKKYVSKFNNKYLLNRVGGGINSEEDDISRRLKLIASRNKRELE